MKEQKEPNNFVNDTVHCKLMGCGLEKTVNHDFYDPNVWVITYIVGEEVMTYTQHMWTYWHQSLGHRETVGEK